MISVGSGICHFAPQVGGGQRLTAGGTQPSASVWSAGDKRLDHLGAFERNAWVNQRSALGGHRAPSPPDVRPAPASQLA